jgi:D-arabinose 1-dehydrogenase-like Zn-dependent alcohol dehydrogenase
MKAVYYEGSGRFTLGECEVRPPQPGEVRLAVAYCGVCGTDVHIAHGAMDARVRAPQVIGHEMSGTVAELGDGVEGFAVGDAVVVRPLDSRGETPADKGMSHISRNLKFLGIDTPGAFEDSLDADPRADPGTSLGRSRRSRRRDPVPVFGRFRLRQRRDSSGRRRLDGALNA